MSQIEDGTGLGFSAKVTDENQLKVLSTSESVQHHISENKQQAYQVIGTATLAASTVVGLHVKNTSSDKILTVTYIRHQVLDPAGGTALPNASCYYRIAVGRTLTSGGATATAVNVFAGSGNTAEITATQTAPTLGGTAQEIDRWYTKAEGDMSTFNKEGALILPPGGTIELAYVGDHTSGLLYTRMSFLMEAF